MAEYELGESTLCDILKQKNECLSFASKLETSAMKKKN